MNAAALVREARTRSGLTLREHAHRAGTSHTALAAYEHGRTTPGTATLERIVAAAGFTLDVTLTRGPDLTGRGDELWQALELADMFPSRPAPELRYPRFA